MPIAEPPEKWGHAYANRTHHPLHLQPDSGGGLWFSEETHAIEAALEGQGIALRSNVIIDRELANGSLISVLDFAIEGLTFYLVYRRDTPRQQEVRRLAAVLREEAGQAAA